MKKNNLYQKGYKDGKDEMYTKMRGIYKSEKYLTEKEVKEIKNNWDQTYKWLEEKIVIMEKRPTHILSTNKLWFWLDNSDLNKVYAEWFKDGIARNKDMTHFALMIQTALVNKNEVNHE